MAAIPSAFQVHAAYNLQYSRSDPTKLEIEVQIDDAELRRATPGFDGLERTFALLPRTTATGVEWDRLDLNYVGSVKRWSSLRTIDVHRGASTGIDFGALSQYGFAVGAECNGQTVWAQSGSGGNYTAHPSLLVEL